MENITHGFNQPNVIDLKLGTQLFDPLDPKLTADKQARMEAEAARTTTGSDGLRLTGFTVRIGTLSRSERYATHRKVSFRSMTTQQALM